MIVLSTSAAIAALLTVSKGFADSPSTYQVTGPVLSVTDSVITVQKGSNPWEIARSSATKVTGDLKVGSKVKFTYTMTAVSVEVKPPKVK